MHLEAQLHYAPFVFNTLLGIFIFTKKRADPHLLSIWIHEYFESIQIEGFRLIDCSEDPKFFRKFTRQVLGNHKASALAWKRYLNSFLHQVKPFSPGGNQGIKVFSRLKKTVKETGNPAQKKYLKQRIKILRDRVSLTSIEAIIGKKES